MQNSDLILAASEWQEKIHELKALIDQLTNELVEAEAELADQLAAINAFEFRLRAGIGFLIRRLDELARQIEAYQQQLRHQQQGDDPHTGNWSIDDVEDVYHEPGVDYDAYRYHETPPEPPQSPLGLDEKTELKRLYRQLARRFHPDMGLDEADRTRRTKLMMAINAAYAAADLDALRQLALEPDSILVDLLEDGQLQAEQLLREMARLQHRLSEVRDELAKVAQNKSYKLLLQAKQTELAGGDWLEELKAQVQEQISMKLVERDVLQQEIAFRATAVDTNDDDDSDFQSDAFADAVWDITLEHAYDEDPEVDMEEFVSRRRDRFQYDEDILDDME